jgi:hypothetical protein
MPQLTSHAVDKRGPRVGAPRKFHRARQPVLEQPPVRQPGQVIVQHQVFVCATWSYSSSKIIPTAAIYFASFQISLSS